MRLVLFLLALVPLVTGSSCPAFLEGLDLNSTITPVSTGMAGQASGLGVKIHDIVDAVDVACGRSNFTTAFWSNIFVQHLILHVVIDELDKTGKALPGFKPLGQSVKDAYSALEDEKAKAYVDAFFAHQRKSRRRRLTSALLMKEITAMLSLNFAHILPNKSQIALAQATKKAFGVVETDEIKKARIDTAMSSIERLGAFSNDERMAEFFPKLYELATNNFAMGKSAFEEFANDIEDAWVNSTTISHMEVVPAVETLFVQYHTLNDTVAKQFVDLFIASMVVANSDYKPVKDDEFDRSQYTKAQKVVKASAKSCRTWNLYPRTQRAQWCFKGQSEKTQAKIRSTFPEVFAYLDSKFSMDNWAHGTTEKSGKKDSTSEI